MPVECESRAAESGADVRATSARWLAASRTNSEPRRFVRSARLHDAGDRERDARFADDPEIDAEDARLNRQATVAALRETALRSLVSETCSGGLWPPKWAGGVGGDRPPLQGGSYSLGRHFRSLSRAAHRESGGESIGSAWVQCLAVEGAEMLRPACLQPGKSRCRV